MRSGERRLTVFFSYAFRPLFLLMTIYALVAVPVWVSAWVGWLPTPMVMLGNPTWWHAHEMLFGFAGAAVGGFLLTAVATWTKRAPVAGAPLVLLSALWLAARVLLFMPGTAASGLVLRAAAVCDLGYGLLLLGLMSREVIAVRSRRNYKVLLILALLVVANAGFYAGIERRGAWIDESLLAALWLFILLINVIGGRIVPAFTSNWLRLHASQPNAPRALPPSFDNLDLAATLLLVAFAVLSLTPAPPVVAALTGVAAGLLLLFRLTRWQGFRAAADPLVWILHVAFLWIPIGVLLLSGAELGWWPSSAGIHALTSGAIATMIIAVASRAALGHTGRPLRSHPVLNVAYAMITLAAALRVMVVALPNVRSVLILSAVSWCVGFACFAWRYVPVLVQPGVERRLPGLRENRRSRDLGTPS